MMQFIVREVLEGCSDHIFWLPRNTFIFNKKTRSGYAITLSAKNNPHQTTVARVRLFSSLKGNPDATPTLLCDVTASVASALGILAGDTVEVIKSCDALGIPRAVTVTVLRLPNGQPAVFDSRLIGQAHLGDIVGTGHPLRADPSAKANAYQILNITVPAGTEVVLLEPGAAACLNQDTRYELLEHPSISRARFSKIASPEAWRTAVERRVAGLDAVSEKLIGRMHQFFEYAGRSDVDACGAGGFVSGLLLTGRPGVGKTVLAKALIGEGDAEVFFADLFRRNVTGEQIVVLDEIDVIAATIVEKQTSVGTAPRILAVLLSLLDGRLSSTSLSTFFGYTYVLGITNRLHTIDPDLLRSGRLNAVVEMDVVDSRQRLVILRHMCRGLPLPASLSPDILQTVSDATHGFVGADLQSLCHGAISHWQQHASDRPELCAADFQAALLTVKPASFQGLTSPIPSKTFADLFGLEDVISHIRSSVLRPFSNLEKFTSLGIKPPRGVLIHGPAGTGKSVLSYALVAEAGFNCVYVDGPKVRSKVVGESEQNIARIFAQARANAPCILLIDQVQ
ncbi:hypothetical protein HKX48_007034 [Thoreauomyces humboldtii]|nr:hypothetical protein HKX48_007034 [Thoreauomyces humboldtii]